MGWDNDSEEVDKSKDDMLHQIGHSLVEFQEALH